MVTDFEFDIYYFSSTFILEFAIVSDKVYATESYD